MVCDFCSSPAPAWRYPAESFPDLLLGRSVGDWLACDECHALIEAGDRNGLTKRSMLTPAVRQGHVEPEIARWFSTDLHRRFFLHRTGPAVPWP